MNSAAVRFATGLALAFLAAEFCLAADASRTVPTRPAPPRATAPAPAVAGPAARVTLRVAGVEYVEVGEVARWLGLKGAWTDRSRAYVFTDPANSKHTLKLEANGREAWVDGLWLHLGNPTVVRSGKLYLGRIDLERSLGPIMRPHTAAPPMARPTVIALDPGHGGGDPGMENKPLALQEKALTLDVSLRLKKNLEAAGFKVVMTRTDDRTFSPEKKKDLPARADFANRHSADLFVSIHFNSLFPDTKTAGAEIYVYTPQGQRSTQSWGAGEADDAAKEPAAVNRYDGWSALLAHHVHRAVVSKLGSRDRGHKTMHALVLQDLQCPAVLVEALFLSSPTEARRAATPAYRQQIAEALAAGVRDYVTALDAARPKS
jgi:N-acetylmuramoyl-L-alanine amidase